MDCNLFMTSGSGISTQRSVAIKKVVCLYATCSRSHTHLVLETMPRGEKWHGPGFQDENAAIEEICSKQTIIQRKWDHFGTFKCSLDEQTKDKRVCEGREMSAHLTTQVSSKRHTQSRSHAISNNAITILNRQWVSSVIISGLSARDPWGIVNLCATVAGKHFTVH